MPNRSPTLGQRHRQESDQRWQKQENWHLLQKRRGAKIGTPKGKSQERHPENHHEKTVQASWAQKERVQIL